MVKALLQNNIELWKSFMLKRKKIKNNLPPEHISKGKKIKKLTKY